MSSAGSATRSARTTVKPPTPESKTPIGRWLLGLPARGGERLVIAGANGATIATPGVFPDKLQECQGLLREGPVQIADPGKHPFRDLEMTFRDETAHVQSLRQETIQGKFRSAHRVRRATDF